MPKCRDCAHWKVCREYVTRLAAARGVDLDATELEQIFDSDDCDQFHDRSRFLELPCKVGDKVYLDNLHIKYADVIGIYIDAFGGVFDLRIYTNIQLANGFGYEYFISKDYTFEDIGKRIFLTKESAEQALKERE